MYTQVGQFLQALGSTRKDLRCFRLDVHADPLLLRRLIGSLTQCTSSLALHVLIYLYDIPWDDDLFVIPSNVLHESTLPPAGANYNYITRRANMLDMRNFVFRAAEAGANPYAVHLGFCVPTISALEQWSTAQFSWLPPRMRCNIRMLLMLSRRHRLDRPIRNALVRAYVLSESEFLRALTTQRQPSKRMRIEAAHASAESTLALSGVFSVEQKPLDVAALLKRGMYRELCERYDLYHGQSIQYKLRFFRACWNNKALARIVFKHSEHVDLHALWQYRPPAGAYPKSIARQFFCMFMRHGHIIPVRCLIFRSAVLNSHYGKVVWAEYGGDWHVPTSDYHMRHWHNWTPTWYALRECYTTRFRASANAVLQGTRLPLEIAHMVVRWLARVWVWTNEFQPRINKTTRAMRMRKWGFSTRDISERAYRRARAQRLLWWGKE